MSNHPRRDRRLHLPASSWPSVFAFAATPGMTDEAALQEAIQRTYEQLESAPEVRRASRRTEIRWVVLDSDECDAILADLGVDPAAHLDLRLYCLAHPGGRLVAASCSYEPSRRRFTILGG